MPCAYTVIKTSEVLSMKMIFSLSSITYANKAKKVLNERGIYCEVIKTPKNFSSGCGYSIKVKDNPDMIIEILRENNILYKDYLVTEK